MMDKKRIVITGLGVVAPCGVAFEALQTNEIKGWNDANL